MALLLLSADPDRGHDLNGQEESPLHMAAREGLEDVVRKILESPWVEEESTGPLCPSEERPAPSRARPAHP